MTASIFRFAGLGFKLEKFFKTSQKEAKHGLHIWHIIFYCFSEKKNLKIRKASDFISCLVVKRLYLFMVLKYN